MMKFFVEIEFKSNEELYWFPFFIETLSESDADDFIERHVASLSEKYIVTYFGKELFIEGINSERLNKYRNTAFKGKPNYIQIKGWILLNSKDKSVETIPEMTFSEALKLEIWDTGEAKAQEIKRNIFPVQKITLDNKKEIENSEVIVINIFLK